LIATLKRVSHGEDRGDPIIVTVKHHVSGVAELNEPLPKLTARRTHRSPNIRVRNQKLDALSDSASRTSCRITVLRGEESVETSEVVQRGGRPNDPRHKSTMRLGWLAVFSIFETFEPCVRLF
jgi:hypothetical protein